MTAPYEIRLIGDPVLRQRAGEVADIDGKVARLADDMLTTMYEAPGLGLAAPQVGVQKRIFVYDVGDGPRWSINPEIRESRGEWAFDEGCLSIPGLAFELIRPKEVHLVGYDLEGNELSIEADELLGPLLPARARPPRWGAVHRAARRRRPQGGHEDHPGAEAHGGRPRQRRGRRAGVPGDRLQPSVTLLR